MAKPTLDQMIAREHARLNTLTKAQLLDELYGDRLSKRDLVDDLMDRYKDEIRSGEIVPCSECGRDCTPHDEDKNNDSDWCCEICSEED